MLILIATPIGNLGDLSPRAEEALRGADIIAAEDTRVTGGLLHKFGIKTRMISYHEHNAEKARPLLLEALSQGKKVALVSDAGTPLISDPGYKLAREAIDRGYKVTGVPGPSAPLLALILSGLPTERFFFGGFLPPKRGERKRYLSELKEVPSTLLFFETAPRLFSSLEDCAEILGNRECAIARELTKLYEEIIRGTLKPLADQFSTAKELKGEIVLVIGPPLPKEIAGDAEIKERLGYYLKDNSPSKAAALVAKELGMERSKIYDLAITMNKDGGR